MNCSVLINEWRNTFKECNSYIFIHFRSNIFINIQRSSEKYEDELQWLIKGVQQKGITMNKTMENVKNCTFACMVY